MLETVRRLTDTALKEDDAKREAAEKKAREVLCACFGGFHLFNVWSAKRLKDLAITRAFVWQTFGHVAFGRLALQSWGRGEPATVPGSYCLVLYGDAACSVHASLIRGISSTPRSRGCPARPPATRQATT